MQRSGASATRRVFGRGPQAVARSTAATGTWTSEMETAVLGTNFLRQYMN